MMSNENIIELSDGEKEELLSLARIGVSAAVKGSQDVDEVLAGRGTTFPFLLQKQGVFVTLRKEGVLRGCIGTIQSDEPLYKAVVESAISAAVQDPRFVPMTEEELTGTKIEISVLSPLKPVKEVREIIVGVHGLYIRKGLNAGLLLPQVATEYEWDREEFLEQCCRKAGLRKDEWRDEETQIMIFTAQVFGEGKNA